MTLIDELIIWFRSRPRLIGDIAFLGQAEIEDKKAEELAKKFVEAISRATGLPPEAINEEIAMKWAKHWMRAMTKPEYWERLTIA